VILIASSRLLGGSCGRCFYLHQAPVILADPHVFVVGLQQASHITLRAQTVWSPCPGGPPQIESVALHCRPPVPASQAIWAIVSHGGWRRRTVDVRRHLQRSQCPAEDSLLAAPRRPTWTKRPAPAIFAGAGFLSCIHREPCSRRWLDHYPIVVVGASFQGDPHR
jgi:hypothetical protein